jgi:hypothetical protein
MHRHLELDRELDNTMAPTTVHILAAETTNNENLLIIVLGSHITGNSIIGRPAI